MSNLHIVCPVCTGVNRVPQTKIGDGPLCGKCKNSLFTGQPVEMTGETFNKHISRSDIPVVVDFWAPWCGPCKMMGPVFSQAAGQMEPLVRLAKVNTEQQQSVAAQFAIRSIPTLVLFKGGNEVVRQPGAMDLSGLVNWIRTHI